ncbi:NAD(P)-dependent oxidoreductase [Pseudomonas sp. RL_15y_Pfl2_60]|uniref:NAD(P)-dependent oxidoreductase n=1 Tax=Pseudomonas sp. RL_15y_Pfl2_60 TaxID=3088709 RepID=UPI0030DB6536
MELVFIGFGEAAYHIAMGLSAEGNIRLGAFDAYKDDPKTGPLIQQRAAQAQITLFDTLEEACCDARFIICLTSATSALALAERILPLLKSGQHYVDMNSAAPAVKQAIEQLPRAAGVGFCDIAVMGTVPGNNHRVPMLLAGSAAQAFEQAFTPRGMRLTVLDAAPGAASAIKMLKSVVMKGLPQLLLESFQGAERFGVLDTLIASLGDSLNGKTVEQLATTFTARTLIHAKRRGAELDDVVATLESVGVDASMSIATRNQLEKLATRDWASLLGPGGSDLNYRDAIAHLTRKSEVS